MKKRIFDSVSDGPEELRFIEVTEQEIGQYTTGKLIWKGAYTKENLEKVINDPLMDEDEKERAEWLLKRDFS